MATIRNRNGRWFAEVRKHGTKPVRRTFETKALAKKWAVSTEASMENGSWLDVSEQRTTLISPLIRRYVEKVNTIRPMAKSKKATLLATAREFEGVSIHDMSPEMLFEYGQRRRVNVSAHTLNQEMTYLAQVIDLARTIWKVPVSENTVRGTKEVMSQLGVVGSSEKRNRRLLPGELSLLLNASGDHWIGPMIEAAVHTAMRQGEIHRMVWEEIDFEDSTILIRNRKHPTQKQGNDMVIPMFKSAREVLLREYNRSKRVGRLWEVERSESISDRFALVRKKAGLVDLRFHDLRHEATSRLFDAGLSIPQVAAVTGHTTWKQLERYTKLKLNEALTGVDI